MEMSTLQAQQTLHIRQRFTFMINRYEVWTTDTAGNLQTMVCFAEQKRLAFKEQVTFYTDDTKTHVLAGFKARRVIDLGGTYDVTDGAGVPIGTFRKDFAASLLRSTYHLDQPGLQTATGQERNLFVALIRRFTDLSFLPYHFDFTHHDSVALSVQKVWGIRDMYTVTINNPHLDRRLVIAMAVALDALQSR